jgi:hypothetical protein
MLCCVFWLISPKCLGGKSRQQVHTSCECHPPASTWMVRYAISSSCPCPRSPRPPSFFFALVAVLFTTLAVAVRRCLLSAANAHRLAARLSSTDTGATAASHLPAELLLPLVALYFIMADCYIVASAPTPSSHCCSRRYPSHRFVIVTAHPHLQRNPFRRRKRQKKSIFIYGTTN